MSFLDFLTNLFFGGLSGSLTKTLVAPLERIKIVLQLQDVSLQISKEKRYKGILDCAVRIYREQGILSFWRGNWTNSFVRYFPTQAIAFACDDSIRKLLIDDQRNYSKTNYLGRSMLSGAMSGAIAQVFVYPLDVARTRLTADVTEKNKKKLYSGAIDCIVKVLRSEGGIGALYKGFMISIGGNILYKGIYFGGYDSMKKFYQQYLNKEGHDTAMRNLSFLEKWMIGQGATTTAQLLSYPFDTVRRRLILRGTKTQNNLYKNSWQCAKKIWIDEGYYGFLKGSLANTFRGLGGALGLVCYDEIQNSNWRKSLLSIAS